MTATLHRLTVSAIDNAAVPATLADGGGLTLFLHSGQSKHWVFRYTFAGRRRELGLGGYPIVSLGAAREEAERFRKQIREGVDPIERRREVRAKQQTFKDAFEDYFSHKQKELSNPKHVAQWTSTMETYVYPFIGGKSVDTIAGKDIVALLKPIWRTKPETASRVLQRVRNVFDAAIQLGNRTAANPCTGITQVLGKLQKQVAHHPALPYGEAPAFIARLHSSGADPITKLAFEFLILTAGRSGEIREALAAEVDAGSRLWTIPASRMKARRDHVVPLSKRAMEVYRDARKLTGDTQLLFPSREPERPLSDMVFTKLMRDWGVANEVTAHGFRSTFKDWCAEVDKARDEVSEVALAHADPNKARAAYKRSAYLEERKPLMQRWSEYLEPPTTRRRKNAKP